MAMAYDDLFIDTCAYEVADGLYEWSNRTMWFGRLNQNFIITQQWLERGMLAAAKKYRAEHPN